MGRDAEYPLTVELALNLADLLCRVNFLRAIYGHPLSVSSGYRPGHFNKAAGGAKNSSHLTCEAVDLRDPNGHFARWIVLQGELLERLDLYVEDPLPAPGYKGTPGWVHIQSRKVPSGNRIFRP
jgi:hypothetical protein